MNIKEIKDKRKLQHKFNGVGEELPCLDCEHFDGSDYLPPCGHKDKICDLFYDWRKNAFVKMSEEIAGVQPMSGSTGDLFKLKAVYLDGDNK